MMPINIENLKFWERHAKDLVREIYRQSGFEEAIKSLDHEFCCSPDDCLRFVEYGLRRKQVTIGLATHYWEFPFVSFSPTKRKAYHISTRYFETPGTCNSRGQILLSIALEILRNRGYELQEQPEEFFKRIVNDVADAA